MATRQRRAADRGEADPLVALKGEVTEIRSFFLGIDGQDGWARRIEAELSENNRKLDALGILVPTFVTTEQLEERMTRHIEVEKAVKTEAKAAVTEHKTGNDTRFNRWIAGLMVAASIGLIIATFVVSSGAHK